MKSLAVFKDKALRNTILAIAFPIALQNLITYCTGMMDTIMVGQLGEIQLSGAAVANQFSMIFMGITFGISSGTNVLLSQYWGKKNTYAMRSILAIMYWVTLAIAVIFFGVGFCFPQQVIGVFTPDTEVIAEGAKYLKIVCISYLGMGLSNVILMTLRSVGTVKVSVITYLTSLIVNTTLNYALIFGHFGAPALGIEGAAIATVIARGIEFVIAIIFMFCMEKKIALKLKNLFALDVTYMKDLIVNVLPVIFNEMLWSVGNSTLMVIMGHMGRAFVTANSITSITMQLSQIITIGISNATSVIIGNTIGEEKYDVARDISRGMVTVAGFIGIFAGTIIFLIRPLIIGFYNIPEETKVIVMSVMAVSSVVVFFQTIAIIEFMGILRGGGDIHFVLIADILFMWILAIPLGAVAGLVFGLPPAIVFLILKIDEMIKIIAGTYRIYKGQWIKNLTR